MKLWLLEAVTDWEPWWNTCSAMVVRASTEDEARLIASEHSSGSEPADAWLDSKITACEVISLEGEAGVICEDIHEA